MLKYTITATVAENETRNWCMQIVQQLKFFYTWPWILIFFLAGAFLLFSVTQKTLRHRFLISFVFYDLLLQIRKWRNLRVLVIFFKPNLYLCFWFCMSGLKINYSLEFPQIHIHGWFPESGTAAADQGLIQSQDRAKKNMRWHIYVASLLYQTQMPPDFTIELCVWGGLGVPIYPQCT